MSIDDLFTGGSKSAFNKDSVVGQVATGTIISAVERQVTDFVTKAPLFWDDGQPRQQVVVTIQTDERADQDDDGQRSIYIKTWGLDKQAFVQAISDAGCKKASEALAPGNIFTATFTGTQPSKYGSDQKIYAYRIQRAAPVNAFDQPPTPQAAPAAPAPAPTQAPASNPMGMIQAGWSDEQIIAATGLTPEVLTMLRANAQTA